LLRAAAPALAGITRLFFSCSRSVHLASELPGSIETPGNWRDY